MRMRILDMIFRRLILLALAIALIAFLLCHRAQELPATPSPVDVQRGLYSLPGPRHSIMPIDVPEPADPQ